MGSHPFPREIVKYIDENSTEPLIGTISTKLGTKHLWVKWTQRLTNKDHSVIRKEMIVLFLYKSTYEKIIALSKCVYCCKLVSQVSDVAHGPLV